VESAEVVIIGGGAVGAATAFNLARLGVTDVVLVERHQLAAGSTSKSAGGIRFQFADELNIRIMLRCMPEFERFAEIIGEHCEFVPDIAFHQTGYLFLLDNATDADAFEGAVALQRRLGVETQILTPAEAAEIVPQLVVDDLLMATFCPREGHCAPEAVVQGHAQAAAAHGVRIRTGTEVTGITTSGGRITAVETSAGPIATGTVVCAAGAWSREVGAMAGVEIPVEGERHYMWFSPEAGGAPEHMPLTIDFSTGFYSHREGQGLVFGGREHELEDLAEPLMKRLPFIAELPIASSWWGYYEVSPDHNAIVGETADLSRFLVATGFSGHGFQQAPAVGEHLAELICGRTPSLDLSAFSLDRFARGATRVERFVV
jgi:sarcosine oxidase subunit beta